MSSAVLALALRKGPSCCNTSAAGFTCLMLGRRLELLSADLEGLLANTVGQSGKGVRKRIIRSQTRCCLVWYSVV